MERSSAPDAAAMFIANDVVNVSHRERANWDAASCNPGQEVVGCATITTNRLGGEAPLLAQPGFVGAQFGDVGVDSVIGFDPAKVVQKVDAMADEALLGLACGLSVGSATFRIGPEPGSGFNVIQADPVAIARVQKPHEVEMGIRMLSQGAALCPTCFQLQKVP